MRLIILLLVGFIVLYLTMIQIQQNTPATTDPNTGKKVLYGKQLEKARGVQDFLQQQADKRLEEVDALTK